MCLAQGPQRSDDCEVHTRGPSVSSQSFYQWATALPPPLPKKRKKRVDFEKKKKKKKKTAEDLLYLKACKITQ